MDVDRCAEKFTSLMIEAAYISMPVKRPRTHARMSPWWDNGLDQLRMTVRNTRNDFAHERDLETRSQKYNVYKRFRNRFANACQKQRESWRRFLEDSKTNNCWGSTYKLIKAITNPKVNALPILDDSPLNQHPEISTNLLNGLFPDDPVPTQPLLPPLTDQTDCLSLAL